MKVFIAPLILSLFVTHVYGKMAGIWYSTWYTKNGNYIWIEGHGAGSQNKFLADVNGDGKDDAIVYFDILGYEGNWYVAFSDGTKFQSYTLWKTGLGTNSTNQFVADVNGDGMCDAVVYYPNGSWYCSLSTGTNFLNYSQWSVGHGAGSSAQFLADTSGDGCSDAIVFWDETSWPGQNGIWYVHTSNGSNYFNGANSGFWRKQFGGTATEVFVANVDESDANSRADAIAYFDNNDSWWIAPSHGSAFGGHSEWAIGFGDSAENKFIADVNADGRGDVVAYYAQSGKWFYILSSGSAFGGVGDWKAEHGNGNRKNPAFSVWQGMGDVYGVNSSAPVVSYADGDWNVMPPSQFYQPAELNLWEAWDIAYLPEVGSDTRTYDSNEIAVIDQHLSLIKAAGIIFLILDLTNNVETQFIKSRALTLRSRVQTTQDVYYTVAIGGIQFDHQPSTLESEAEIVWNDFANGDVSYFNLESKPLLVCYGSDQDKISWENYTGTKTYASKFTLRWAKGEPTSQNVVPSEYHLYYGWAFTEGSLPNQDSMVVMPGWNNHLGNGNPVPRNNGLFYQNNCWDRVMQSDPELVIINSFNEYAEETAVAPSVSLEDPWPANSFYWSETIENISDWKGL